MELSQLLDALHTVRLRTHTCIQRGGEEGASSGGHCAHCWGTRPAPHSPTHVRNIACEFPHHHAQPVSAFGKHACRAILTQGTAATKER